MDNIGMDVVTENEKIVNKSRFPKKNKLILIVIAVALLICVTIIIVSSQSTSKRLAKQLDLGQKYLEEMDYEQAIVAFNKAIEIDPMSVEAYLGMVEVYIRTTDFEIALEYAEKGYEATGDERLKEKIDSIIAVQLAEQLDLGNKYLEEMDYEQAIAAFNKALEIDPINADAYLGLVEVYIRTTDFETALEYAKKGYEVTGDERLKEKIDMIESGSIFAENGWKMKTSYYNNDNELNYYITYTYNLKGEIATATAYAPDDSLIDKVDYKYDENGRKIWGADDIVSDYDGTSSPLGRGEYVYDDNGRFISIKYYSADGRFRSWSEFEYKEDGNTVVTQHLRDGEYIESEGNQTRYYDEKGNLIRYDEKEYDENGYRTSYKGYDRDGNLLYYTEYEYDENGRLIKSTHYNANGEVESTTVYE
jgi:Tfp pilus assembly protein PilF